MLFANKNKMLTRYAAKMPPKGFINNNSISVVDDMSKQDVKIPLTGIITTSKTAKQKHITNELNKRIRSLKVGLILTVLFSLSIVAVVTVFRFNGFAFSPCETLSNPPEGFTVVSCVTRMNRFYYNGPPSKDDLPALAKYVMHISDLGTLTINSTQNKWEENSFTNVINIGDGAYGSPTGIPYFYLTPVELSANDALENNTVSLTLSRAQHTFCLEMKYDPKDPRCAHFIYTGLIKKIEKGSEGEKAAKQVLVGRHKSMRNFPSGEDNFYAKLDIHHIHLQDNAGDVKSIDLNDYFAAKWYRKD